MAEVSEYSVPLSAPLRSDSAAGPRLVADELPLFRFGLRHLMFLVTAVSALLAGLVSLPGLTAVALLLAAVVIALHVLGTALGSQLRLRADRATSAQVAAAASDIQADRGTLPHPATSLPPWYGRSRGSFAWFPRTVAAAVVCGGVIGTLFLTATIGHRTSLAGLVIGGVSIAVLSGWFAFIGSSFFAVVRHGFREAAAEPRRDHHLVATSAKLPQ